MGMRGIARARTGKYRVYAPLKGGAAVRCLKGGAKPVVRIFRAGLGCFTVGLAPPMFIEIRYTREQVSLRWS